MCYHKRLKRNTTLIMYLEKLKHVQFKTEEVPFTGIYNIKVHGLEWMSFYCWHINFQMHVLEVFKGLHVRFRFVLLKNLLYVNFFLK